MLELIPDEHGRAALRLQPRTGELLTQVLSRADENGDRDELLNFLALALEDALKEVAGNGLREPSYAQVTYAIAIARDLSISIPADALKHRRATQRFLSEFAPLHKRLSKPMT